MSPAAPRRRGRKSGIPTLSTPRVKSDLREMDPKTQNTLSGRWVWYLLSFFFPFAGMLAALFLYEEDSWEVRKIGRNCLLISFLVWIVLPFLLGLALLLFGALALAGIASNVLSPAD
jgi:hypothetical protein